MRGRVWVLWSVVLWTGRQQNIKNNPTEQINIILSGFYIQNIITDWACLQKAPKMVYGSLLSHQSPLTKNSNFTLSDGKVKLK